MSWAPSESIAEITGAFFPLNAKTENTQQPQPGDLDLKLLSNTGICVMRSVYFIVYIHIYIYIYIYVCVCVCVCVKIVIAF